jgi:hypothetical protein
MANGAYVKVEIQQSDNTWLDVSDGTVYRINKASFENSAVTFRRDEVTNAFIEGKFLVNALRDNVTETLAIYAYGATSAAVKSAVDTVTDAISQVNFMVRITLDNSQKIWECFSSDYTINMPKEFLVNKQALITVQLQRLPSETVTTV